MSTRTVVRGVTRPVVRAISNAIGDGFYGESGLTLHYNFASQPDLRSRNALGPTLDITRTTTATFLDQESLIRTVQTGEARFTGCRRVENLALDSNDY